MGAKAASVFWEVVDLPMPLSMRSADLHAAFFPSFHPSWLNAKVHAGWHLSPPCTAGGFKTRANMADRAEEGIFLIALSHLVGGKTRDWLNSLCRGPDKGDNKESDGIH